MSGTHTAKKLVTHPYLSLICFLSMCVILPRYVGVAVTMVGCASVLSVLVAVLPDQFRSRSGSMRAAIWLIATMWIGAAVITALTLTGEIRD